MSESPGTPEATTDPEIAFDAGHFRMVLGHFPTGVTIVTGLADGNRWGSRSVRSPPCRSTRRSSASSPRLDSITWEAIAPSGKFCVNVLSAEQDDLCWKFAKSGTELTRFEGVDWHPAPSGSPVLDRAVAWIDCTVEEVYTMGDHYFVLGHVDYLDADADHDGLPPRPLVFYRGGIGGFASEI